MMSFLINNSSLLFSILFGLLLAITFIMNLQSLHFYTKDVVIRKFSIIDLELAADPKELVNLIAGVYELPQVQSKKTLNAIKGQLYIDFLFMPCAYGSVYLLCIKVAERMQLSLGYYVLMILGWLQVAAWLCDIVENIYLLSKIRPDPVMSSVATHHAYLMMEATKWGIALSGAVCSISVLCYFWLAGHYSPRSLQYIFIVLVEIILFSIAQKFFIKKNSFDENL